MRGSVCWPCRTPSLCLMLWQSGRAPTDAFSKAFALRRGKGMLPLLTFACQLNRHVLTTYVRLYYEWDFACADASFRRCCRPEPNRCSPAARLAWLCSHGPPQLLAGAKLSLQALLSIHYGSQYAPMRGSGCTVCRGSSEAPAVNPALALELNPWVRAGSVSGSCCVSGEMGRCGNAF